MTGATAQPTAMSPHTKGKEQAPVPLEKHQWRKKETTTKTMPRERREERKWQKEPHWLKKLSMVEN